MLYFSPSSKPKNHPSLAAASLYPSLYISKDQNAFYFLVCICLFRTVLSFRYVAVKVLLGGEYRFKTNPIGFLLRVLVGKLNKQLFSSVQTLQP